MVHLTRAFDLAAVVHRGQHYHPLSTDTCREELAEVQEEQRRYELELFLKVKTEDTVAELQTEVSSLEEQIREARRKLQAEQERKDLYLKERR